mmetsp:Transcript_10225/g.30362  ORF Transcript_10225/g.30362 Transcript_10225/m.30362 type:complete len:212 (+) Transcript_10225:87-722(+)
MIMNCCLAAALASSGPAAASAAGARGAWTAWYPDSWVGLAGFGRSAAPAGGALPFAAAFSAFVGFCTFFAAAAAASSSAFALPSRAFRASAPQSSSSETSAKTTPVGTFCPFAGSAAPSSVSCSALRLPELSGGSAWPPGLLPHSRRRRRKSLRSISMATWGLYCIIGEESAPPRSQRAKPARRRHSASAKASTKPGWRFRNSRSKKRVAT